MVKDDKALQIREIKTRLASALERAELNIYQLTKAINQSKDIFDVNYNTVKSCLDFTSPALDTLTVIAICRYLHLDTAYILSPPDTVDASFQNNENFSVSGKFTFLKDKKYFGTFHGFFYSPNENVDEIIRFELIIEKDEKNADKPSARLDYHGRPTDIDGNTIEDHRTLCGTPYVDTLHSNIFILFTNDLGDFYFFYYNWQIFRTRSLYFRRGAALTSSTVGNNSVLSMNFVFFAKPVSDKNLPYIRGLLKDVSPTFFIPCKEAKSLCDNNELIQRFFDEFGYILEHDKKEIYDISETTILSSRCETMSKNDIVQALLLLKEHSLSSERILYPDTAEYSKFCKEFLQHETTEYKA